MSVLACILILACAPAGRAQDRVSETVHNLSVTGPGLIRAASERQVCIFCHAPHNTNGVRPLWNRELPTTSYQIYQSSTLNAPIGQPSGSSKLCLSCHDGTIALGSVLSRFDRIRMTTGDFLPAGLTNLGTDLSDDHPISFFYTAGIAAADGQLADPGTIGPEVRLDAAGRLQCTACHDPHNNTFGKFLVKDNTFGALCTTCHQMTGWPAGTHKNATVSVSGVTAATFPYSTVAENACRSCHRSHTAGGHERLLIFEQDEENCLDCHGGQVGGRNILAELDKFSSHDPRNFTGIHDPIEQTAGLTPHVECADCHNPHAVQHEPAQGSYIPIGATLTNVVGVDIGGTLVKPAQHEYEVCFRCHGDSPVLISGAPIRQVQLANLRLMVSPGNPSFHPLVTAAPSPDTVSLVPGLTRGSLIRCTDCHNNDAGRQANGGGPVGPHGSIYDFLLERNYTITDNTSESDFEYALCYKCHRRESILNDDSFREHDKHIRGENAPCSACHDPHGISLTQAMGSDHTHLINFDVRIVRPDPQTGRLEFRDLGRFAGSCTLECHGEVHRDETYGPGRGG